jgi:cytochrome c-type biogenesis protein CcmH/NrfG
MRPLELTQDSGAASVAVGSGMVRDRMAALASRDYVPATAWLLSFVTVVVLGADSGGYWPTSWGWTALALLFIGAIVLLAADDPRLGRLEAIFPAALLALAVWGLVSAAWSASATQPVLLSQRSLLYASAAFVGLLLVRSRSYRFLLGGVWAAIALISCYALLTRLFPERVGFVDSVAGHRLESPLGYWNALGIFTAMGTLIAVGFAARGRTMLVRAFASASVVALVPTLYFTFSRGAWIALAAGVVTVLLLDARRLQFVTAAAVVAPWPALAVWYASGTELAHTGGGISAAEHVGHRYLLYLLALALAAAGTMAALVFCERRVRIPQLIRLAYGALLVLCLVAGFAAVTARYGSPMTVARKAYHNFVGQNHPVTNGDLNTRLFSLGLGQRIPQWKVAWHEYKGHPWLGTGLGSYERYWNEYRPEEFQVKNVHNLYLETLAELGPLGLALLAGALVTPLIAAVRARKRTLVPAAAGAYVAFLAHAAVDWDWQMPAVTLAALFCGVGLLAAARRSRTSERSLRPVVRGLALGLVVVLGVFAFVGLKANRAIAAAQKAATNYEWSKSAADARSARSWAPWSATPWQLLGEAQAATGDMTSARASFRHAVAKDGSDWSIWLDLALASHGAEQRQAFAAASKLDPLSPQIASRLRVAKRGNG